MAMRIFRSPVLPNGQPMYIGNRFGLTKFPLNDMNQHLGSLINVDTPRGEDIK